MIRKARIHEARAIREVINASAQKGLLIPMSLSEIYEHLRDFSVFVQDNDSNLMGICALYLIWEDLAEIRSLAVKEEYRKKGIGSKLVNACIQEASDLGIKRIFCLTYSKEFFASLGFKEIDKSQLPHKIWAACIKCSKFPECSETAMIYEI